jgi:hypothetical protein
MRKPLVVKAHSLYITFFLFAATVAQAAPRALDPDGNTWWEFARRTVAAVRRAFDVLQFPIG